jgi:hypothetical protein
MDARQVVLALSFLAGAAEGQGGVVEPLPELGLTLTLPPLADLERPRALTWRGTLGASRVEIALRTLPNEKYGCAEPEDVLDIGPSFWRDPRQGRNDAAQRRVLGGPFGFVGYAAWEESELVEEGAQGADAAPNGVRFLLGGLLPDAGYWFTVEAKPRPTSAEEAQLRAFLTSGIVYAGILRDPRWTDAEARARWERDAPPEARAAYTGAVRSEHFLVLTDAAGAPALARKLEEGYAALKKALPFEDVAGRRLLPVFLFRNLEEYQSFGEQARVDVWSPRRAKGHAARDYYATWVDQPGDPVHLRGAASQVLAMRLGLGGGGPWLQEGLAEYFSTKKAERSAAAALGKKSGFRPLAELFALATLSDPRVDFEEGGEPGLGLHAQAGLVVECLREGRHTKDGFAAFLARAASSRRAADVGAALQETYGLDVAGFERLFLEHCKRR